MRRPLSLLVLLLGQRLHVRGRTEAPSAVDLGEVAPVLAAPVEVDVPAADAAGAAGMEESVRRHPAKPADACSLPG